MHAANIASHLPAAAARNPEGRAVIAVRGRNADGSLRHESWTYRRLEQESAALARGMLARGIGPGVRTVLMVRPGLEFFALVFACV